MFYLRGAEAEACSEILSTKLLFRSSNMLFCTKLASKVHNVQAACSYGQQL